MAGKLLHYFHESRDELRKVLWPSRRETLRLTLLVIGITISVAAFLGLVDFGLNLALEQLIH